MASGIETVLARPAEQRQPPALAAPVPQGTLKTSDNFWKEFLRVQSDKLLLLLLIGMLHWMHAPDALQAAAIGALVGMIQGQRFKLG